VFESRVFIPTSKNGKSREVPLSIAARELVKGVHVGKVFNTTASALKQSFQRGVKRARRAYEKDCKVAGVTPNEEFLINLTFHDLRHEGTSRMAEKLSMQELMKVVGHSDPRMVMRYYHPKTDDLAKKLG
jgi:integrase